MPIERNTITCADVLDYLGRIADDTVDCCVSSPPYYGLRDYGTAQWEGGSSDCNHKIDNNHEQGIITSTLEGGKKNIRDNLTGYKGVCGNCGATRADGQIGLEASLDEYIAKMVAVYEEVRRVLKPTGVAFCNIADSYAGSGSKGNVPDNSSHDGGIWADGEHIDAFRNSNKYQGQGRTKTTGGSLKPKDLMLVPFRLALALQEAGWWVRSDIIWHKPNPMPESCRDRPTKSHEYVFLLTKRGKYYFDADAIREPTIPDPRDKLWGTTKQTSMHDHKKDSTMGMAQTRTQADGFVRMSNPAGRNKRTVWTVATEAFPGSHFATFPQALITPMIRAGCPREVCGACGGPVVRVVEKEKPPEIARSETEKRFHNTDRTDNKRRLGQQLQDWYDKNPPTTTGFRATCDCQAPKIPGLVLDMFMGSGTVGIVAIREGRDYIGCDVSPEYVEMARDRIARFDPLQDTPVSGSDGEEVQLSLWDNLRKPAFT